MIYSMDKLPAELHKRKRFDGTIIESGLKRDSEFRSTKEVGDICRLLEL